MEFIDYKENIMYCNYYATLFINIQCVYLFDFISLRYIEMTCPRNYFLNAEDIYIFIFFFSYNMPNVIK